MGRRKGSKNKPKDVKELEKKDKKEWDKATKAFDDLVKRAREKEALIKIIDYDGRDKT